MLTVVVIGVSGVGKSTIARGCADSLGWPFVEGDDFHSAANVAKMRDGMPLADEDRWPWLAAIAERIGRQETVGRSSIVSCSALRRAYRDVLRDGHPSVRFLHLDADPTLLSERIAQRPDHFMPASLLASQLAALEPLAPDEHGARIDVASMTADQAIRRALSAIDAWSAAHP